MTTCCENRRRVCLLHIHSHYPPSPSPPISESWWVDGLILKRVRGGGGEAHDNCMGPTLPLVQTSHTVHTWNTEYNSTLHVHHNLHTWSKRHSLNLAETHVWKFTKFKELYFIFHYLYSMIDICSCFNESLHYFKIPMQTCSTQRSQTILQYKSHHYPQRVFQFIHLWSS